MVQRISNAVASGYTYFSIYFIDPEDIRRGLAVLENERCDYTFSVTRYAFPVQRAVYITQQGRVEMFQPENFNIRSQDLEIAYHDAGQFYWGTRAAWLAGKQIFSSDSAPLVLPHHRVQDIDTVEDWSRAEMMWQLLQKNSEC